ncbi:MAG: PAS domain S-box protein [Bacteriovoracaceae bacterium]|jgi:PAS domain S-box-containing protein|nr:PAS domain S-box protein [Bacteriovoracaceae bacterium]
MSFEKEKILRLERKIEILENMVESKTRVLYQANQKLQNEKMRVGAYQKALNRSAVVCSTDLNGIIKSVNSNFCELSGYGESELIGNNINMVSSGSHEKDEFRNLWDTIKIGNIWRGELKNQKKDGSFYWVDSVILLLMSPEGEQGVDFISIAFDITDRKNAENKIEEQKVQMVRESRFSALGEMAAGIAHEINNPLTVIKTCASILNRYIGSNKLDPEKIKEHAENINQTVDRITKIIEGMKNLSREVESNERSSCGVEEILDDIFGICGEKIKSIGISLEVDVPENLKEKKISLHRIQLSQVIINLLNNSIDAIEESSSAWIKLETLLEDQKLMIRISDSGTGIPEEVQKKLFDPFFTTKKIGKGTGIGLSISKSIVDKMEGTLRLDQDCPNTCFIISVPVGELS